MTGSGKPVVALTVLILAAVLLGGFASPVIPQPPPDHEGGPGCSCHNEGTNIWVNGNDFNTVDDIVSVDVDSAGSFVVTVQSQRPADNDLFQRTMVWMPNVADNAKFIFDPQEVKDNSPQDLSPIVGNIIAKFNITAPSQSGSYTISLWAQGAIIQGFVKVKAASPSGFAAITNVRSPPASVGGALLTVSVTLQNTGWGDHRLYMYVTDRATGKEVLGKVYSQGPVSANATITLGGVFKMPNYTLSLTVHSGQGDLQISNSTFGFVVHSGHVEENQDIDDDQHLVSTLGAMSVPSIQGASLGVLGVQWIPWTVAIAASLGSVPLLQMYSRRSKRALQETAKLKLTVVELAGCALCKNVISDLQEQARLAKGESLIFMQATGNHEPVDIAFVVGSVRTKEDVQTINELRQRAKVLVAFGACPTFGGWTPGERRLVDAEVRGKKQSTTEPLQMPTDQVKPLSDYVKVDFHIPGCPPSLQISLDFLTQFGAGNRFVAEVAADAEVEEIGID
jgi:Ni,Fe-hydrogenase III small subunit